MMRLKISTMGFLMVALLVIATVASVYVAMQTTNGVGKIQQAWVDYDQNAGRKIELVQRLHASLGFGGMIHNFKNFVLRTHQPERYEGVIKAINEAKDVIAEYRSLASSEELVELNKIAETVAAYEKNADVVRDLIAQGKTSQEIDAVVKIDDKPALEGKAALINALTADRERSHHVIESTAGETETLAQVGSYVIAGGLLLVILITSWFLAFRLVKPLKAMTTAMERLARNDLSVGVPGADRKDEIGEMAAAVEVFKKNALQIRQMETLATDIVQSISNTTEQIKSAVNAQAATSSEQAAAVSQTSTSLEEIRETADSTAQRAVDLSSAAEQTLRTGETNRAEMERVVNAMAEIREKVEAIAHTMVVLSEQTRRVGEITDSVSGLARQSKMLAINASIEAAKAGEAGLGFAVVAEEVASLAEQSEQATQQVRNVLEQIQSASEKAIFATEEGTKQVDAGVDLIQSVGSGMHQLLDVIGETVSATRHMVDSIRQQTSGIQQVAGAMSDISQGTTQLAGSSSQIRQSIEGLSSDVARLANTRTD